MLHGYKIIAVCIARLESYRHFEFIKRLNDLAVQNGCRLFIYHTHSDLYTKSLKGKGEKSVFNLIDFSIVDAGIVFEESYHDTSIVTDLIAKFKAHDVPLFNVGNAYEGVYGYPFAYKESFDKVVRHVIEFHNIKKNLAFIAGTKGEVHSEERIKVFYQVCADNNVPESEIRLFYGDFWSGPTKAAVQQMISEKKIPRAIICANDSMAIAAMEELQRNGINVPKDVIVTGFDGIQEAFTAKPALTTAQCSYSDICEVLVNDICARIDKKTVPPVSYIRHKLTIHDSCGCHNPIPEYSLSEILRRTEKRVENFLYTEYSLYTLSENLTFAKSAEEFIENLKLYPFYDMAIFVNKTAMDETVPPADVVERNAFEDDMFLLYRTHSEMRRFPEPFKRSDILPEDDKKFYLQRGNPLVFVALTAFNAPFGYLLFDFDVQLESYSRIMQFSNSVTTNLINFRNNRHLLYAANTTKRMANHDYLTDLYNRKGFMERLPQVVEYARTHGERLLVANFDVNGLKLLNDRYGHEAGDIAITGIGKVLLKLPYENFCCARFGGDEFAYVASVKGMTRFNFASKYVEMRFKDNLEQTLAQYNKDSGYDFEISTSVGIVISEVRNFSFEKSYRIADKKMYRMKNATKDHRGRK